MEPKPTYKTLQPEPVELQPADIAERWWLSFSADHDPTDAAARYIEKVKLPPTYLVEVTKLCTIDGERTTKRVMLLVGPLAVRPLQQPQHVYLTEPAPTVTQGTLF